MIIKNTVNSLSKAKQSKAKQSKAKQSKPLNFFQHYVYLINIIFYFLKNILSLYLILLKEKLISFCFQNIFI